MRPELQKMLSHCGMAENSSSRTTLVSSNQQCSGPLYKGVRQSVSKKAEPPTETGPANKWLLVRREKKKKKRKPALIYATGLRSQSIYFFSIPPPLIRRTLVKSIVLKPHEQWKRIPSHFVAFCSFAFVLHM